MSPDVAEHFMDQEFHEFLCNLEFELTRHYLTQHWQEVDMWDQAKGSEGTVSHAVRRYTAQWGYPL